MNLEHVFDIGAYVQCDWCDHVYRLESGEIEDDTPGGFLFGSGRSGKATGPCCAQRLEENAKRYGEQEFITERCPADKPFAEWVVELRNGDNEIRIYTGDDREVAP